MNSDSIIEGGLSTFDYNENVSPEQIKEEEGVWKRFKEAGAFNEDYLEQKEKTALLQRCWQLESELHGYQHNMGLLLIECNDWTTNCKWLQTSLTEAQNRLTQQQAAHLIALNESAKCEESLKSSLVVEKHCAYDLEKAFRALHSKLKEVNFESNDKIAQSQEIVADNEQKAVATESALEEANTFLVEQINNDMDAQRRLKDLEYIEDALQKERQSFDSECKSYNVHIIHVRESLHDKRKRLEQIHERLVEGKMLLNERENLAEQRDGGINQREIESMIARKKIEENRANLHEQWTVLCAELNEMQIQEEKSNQRDTNIRKREELLALQENLVHKKHVEIQDLILKQKEECEAEKAALLMDMEQHKRLLEDELGKMKHIANMRADSNQDKEGKLLEREKIVMKKTEKLNKLDEDLKERLMSLEKRELSCDSNTRKITMQKQNIEEGRSIVKQEREDLGSCKRQIAEGKQQVQNEQEKLINMKEQYNGLQNLKEKIKEEIDVFLVKEENIGNEANQLMLEKERLLKGYELLKERKEQASKESQQVSAERERIIKWHHDEQARMNKEAYSYMKKLKTDAEVLRVTKEAFINDLLQKQTEWFVQYDRKYSELIQEFKQRKRKLETNIEERSKEMEKDLQERKLELEKKKQRDMQDILFQRQVVCKEMEELGLGKEMHQKIRKEIAKTRKETDMAWTQIQVDIRELEAQTEKLQEQRELLQKEREESLKEFDQLQKLKNELQFLENSFMISKQQSSKDNLRGGSSQWLAVAGTEDSKWIPNSHSQVQSKTVVEKCNVAGSEVFCTGENLANNMMNNSSEGNGIQNLPTLPVYKQGKAKGKSQNKRARQFPLKDAGKQAADKPTGQRRQ